MTNQIGIMSGRLSPPFNGKIQSFPINTWQSEFKKASSCGFEVIEWVFDSIEKNPILDDNGIKEIKSLSEENQIQVKSVCADFFMDNHLFNVSEFNLERNLQILTNLITNCQKLEIKILEIPFLESSSINNQNYQNQVISNLQKILPLAHDNDVKLTLETDLNPTSFRDLLLQFNNENIAVNYDIGNSTSNGFEIKTELEILFPWIANIHIKDRLLHGHTVPLGTGDVNFESFFSIISKLNYNEDFIIQGAREDLENTKIDPDTTCEKYLKFVMKYTNKYLNEINGNNV